MNKDDAYLLDMLYAVQAITQIIKDRDRVALDEDIQMQSAVYWQPCVLGEAANALSDVFRDNHDSIPWYGIIGLRNRLIHGYQAIDNDIIWDVLQNQMPSLLSRLQIIAGEIGH